MLGRSFCAQSPSPHASKPSLLFNSDFGRNQEIQSRGHWGQMIEFQQISHGANGIWSRYRFSLTFFFFLTNRLYFF